MDFQNVVDSIGAMTCVMSVEKLEDGYGEIRVVTGNRAYIDSIEKPTPRRGAAHHRVRSEQLVHALLHQGPELRGLLLPRRRAEEMPAFLRARR